MLRLFEPANALLKKYVDNIYIFEKSNTAIKYTSYPSVNTSVGLFRNAAIEVSGNCFSFKNTQGPNHFAIACNRLFRPVDIHYLQMVDEITINFKPPGFAIFTQHPYPDGQDSFIFPDWDVFLEDLFHSVFATENSAERLAIIEAFLLSRYARITDEELLCTAMHLLSGPDAGHTINEVADLSGVHYKYLYRSFMRHVGCSPAHYRKIAKFRNSVYSKLDKGDATKFIEICYSGNYSDQAYFTKQFREITGENPKKFFKVISAFGNNKVVFKFY
jgi:AraC-like DNA-binding protein